MKHLSRYLIGGLAAAAAISGALTVSRYQSDLSDARQRVDGGEARIAQTACGPIQYADVGQGEPVLAVHGAGGGYDQGLLLARMALGGADGYRVIAPSRFGFLGTPGRDPASPDGDQIAQAGAHACLLDALGIDRVIVLGFSAGGPSSIQFAQRYPERTEALALISAVSPAPQQPPGDTPEWAFQLMLGTDFTYWAMISAAPTRVISMLGVTPDVQAGLSPADRQWARDFLFTMLPMTAKSDGIRYDLQLPLTDGYALEQITAPTLVIHARDDTLVPFDPHAEYNAGHIPGARLVEVPVGGHCMLGQHDRVQAEVAAFLADL